MQIPSWSQEVAAAAHAFHGASATDTGALGAVIAILIVFVLVLLALAVLIIVSWWKIFKKADMPGWATLVPFYSTVKMLQMSNLPLWWVVLMFIPLVNVVLAVILARRIAGVFGHGWGFAIGLICVPFIFYPILAFGSSQYLATAYPPARPMSEAVRWTLIGLMAFVLMETFFFSLGASSNTSHPLTIIGGNLTGFATDGTYVYYNDVPVSGADPLSFHVQGDYGIDDNAVYDYEGVVIPGVSSSDFKVLTGGAYATDGSTVFYDGTPVDGADPATFMALDDLYGKDSNAVYEEGTIVPGADAPTFVLEQGTLGSSTEYDAKDAHHYYSYGQVVK